MKSYSTPLCFIVVIIIGTACHKETATPDAILLAHTWFPYQTHIVSTDSTFVTERNTTTGTQTIRTYYKKKDTSFLNSSCQQQSTLQFQQGNIYLITNNCMNPAAATTAQWFTLPSNSTIIRTYFQLAATPPPGFPSYAFGDISIASITTTQFIITNYFHSSTGMTTNNLQYDSLIVKDSLVYLTCKSR